MDNESKQLLKQVIANQVVIFKRLDQIENKLKNSSRSAPMSSYLNELNKQADQILKDL